MALALSLTGLVLLGAGGWVWSERQRANRIAETNAQVHQALAQANTFREQARLPGGGLKQLEAALSAAARAKAALDAGEEEPNTRQQVESLLAALQRELPPAREAERDRSMLVRLDDVRDLQAEVDVKSSRFDEGRADPAYADAFREYGIDVDALDPETAAARIRARPIAVELATALDHWAFVRSKHPKKGATPADWQRLIAAAKAADPDLWRNRLRNALVNNDALALRELAAQAEALAQPKPILVLLGSFLGEQDSPAEGAAFLRRAQRRHPDDFWINHKLAVFLGRVQPPRRDDQVRFYAIATALRKESPGAWLNLGHALANIGATDEAIAVYQQAVALKPDYAMAHNNLGNAYLDKGDLPKALEALEEALRCDPNLALAYFNLGNLRFRQGRDDEGMTAYQTAVRLDPTHSTGHYNLGNALVRVGRLAEGIAALRESVRLAPQHAESHCNLGLALLDNGEFPEALTCLKRGDALGMRNPRWPYPSKNWVALCERMLDLDRKLPDILAGREKPATVAERLEYARLCRIKGLYERAARFCAEALSVAPKLSEDTSARHLYNAACVAALAAAGCGRDEPPPDAAARSHWRRQALDWLRAELNYWTKTLASKPAAAQAVAGNLQHWQRNPDLAGLRDDAELAKLEKAERESWRRLWADVDALIKEARGKKR
ncbi:MAG: tetratricopeptide repeat protein [Gemmataceae bacterium]|nr:tetratricopeptide repeat protein [Gemmataceae bacterium]